MSGVRRPRGPYYRATPPRWGPAGWYCRCDVGGIARLMVVAQLGDGRQLCHCRHCGTIIHVEGTQIVRQLPRDHHHMPSTQEPAPHAQSILPI